MAITVKAKGADTVHLLQIVGLDPKANLELSKRGIVVNTSLKDVIFSRNGVELTRAKMSVPIATLLKPDSLSATVLSACRGSIVNAMLKAMDMAEKIESSVPLKGSFEDTVIKVKKPPQYPPKLEACPLKDATQMYQPVRGTSGGSKYFVVALSDDVKVAARVQGNAVSVRAEGNLTPKIKAALGSVGMDDKVDYMSAHFTATPNASAKKVVGAVLIGCGLDFDTPVPSVDKIQDKGQ